MTIQDNVHDNDNDASSPETAPQDDHDDGCFLSILLCLLTSVIINASISIGAVEDPTTEAAKSSAKAAEDARKVMNKNAYFMAINNSHS
jgi:hypothetical protein